ncbi:hypothetical protein [Neptuniibacter sp. QD37_11]|uniref:hypothetical protein n=1 Tax=Neptuniibacter sp. QD37_11 TaxID=3398209 RepID=UPI0039F639F7
MKRNEQLNQYFMPVWAAERIIQHYYGDLTAKDLVLDAGCGDGRFLMSIPKHVPAYGVEIDPDLAIMARANSGRHVIEADLKELEFPFKPTLVIGNPPFEMKVVQAILDQAYEHMDYNKEVGLVLPCSIFQTADTVLDMSERWSLKHDLMPRNMFQNMQNPIMFARFIKARKPVLFGMFLYEETSDMLSLKKQYRLKFVGNESSTHLWGEVIEQALIALGGEATLQELYAEIEGKRPTRTQHWKEQIRKVARDSFRKVKSATYGLWERPVYEQTQMALAV